MGFFSDQAGWLLRWDEAGEGWGLDAQRGETLGQVAAGPDQVPLDRGREWQKRRWPEAETLEVL